MPAPTINYTAVQVPAILTPGATVLSPLVGPPTTLPTFNAGERLTVIDKLNRLAATADLLGRWGGGGYALVQGGALTDGGGLTLRVADLQAMLDGPVSKVTATLGYATLALADNIAQICIWFTQGAALVSVNNSLAAPSAVAVFLGSVTTAGGAITNIDASGVLRLEGGSLWRRTSDAGAPGDAPPSTVSFCARTAGGAYWWDGTAYAKFVNPGGVATADLADGAVTTVKLADGAVTPAKTSLPVRNETGGNLVAGDLVYVSGWNESQKLHPVAKADADAGGKRAAYIVTATIGNNANGTGYRTFRLTGLNTNAGNVGDPVYLSTTAGGWTLAAPTAANALAQVVGRIAVKSATVGEIEFDLVSEGVNLFGTNELQDLAVTDGKLATPYVKADGTRAFTGDQSLGSHKLTNVTDPAGAQDAATKAYVDAAVAAEEKLLYANTTVPGGNTVSNSSAQTNFASNKAVAGGTLAVGQVIRITAAGVYGTDAALPGTVNLRVKAGTTVLAATGAITQVANLTNQGWRLEVLLTVTAVGGGGSVEAQGIATLTSALGVSQTEDMANTAVVSVDFSASQTLQVSAEMSQADSDNTYTLRQLVMEVSGP